MPVEAAPARRVQAELGVAAGGRQVATPHAAQPRRAIATTPARVPLKIYKRVATPATNPAQRAKPSENPDAETIPARPESPFSRLNIDQKIQALLEAADNQIDQAADYDASFLDLETTQIGSRNLTAKGCLGFALEIALEKRRAQVPDISLRLARILNAEDQMIPLFGVNFPRARIEAWSREESLPEPIQVHQEFTAKDNELGTAFAGNVHSDPVKEVGEKQLNVMKDRTAIGSKKTVEQTHAEIRDYIATLPSSASALKGLNRIMQFTGGEFNDDASPFLAIVWGYIERCSSQDMKQNLRNSMVIKLAEIATENPCSTGIIERIIDIPTAIDLSLPQDIPEEEVLTELAQMAGNINELFEENYAFDCTGARAAAGDDETSPARIAVEVTISDLKRDMFLEKARIELVVLRNIDSNFVMATANKVFPKGAIL
ncbi:MAG: hypothetical protein H7315_00910 [Herminiimonas sp.]|nr:hypothetical protein [Herminiimonas sp.]